MRASLIGYWAAKEGSSAAEYEDALRVVPGAADELPGHWVAVAVADGATESLLARQWAAMPADEFAVAGTAVRDARLFAETALALSGAMARRYGVLYYAARECRAAASLV